MANPEQTVDPKDIDRIIQSVGREAGRIIPLLHAIQKKYNYLPEDALRLLCDRTDIRPADVTGIASFYTGFRLTPAGEHIIQVCTGTACHVKGAERVYDALCRELRIGSGKDTDPEGRFTLQNVACLGCCTIAPVVQIDTVTYGHVTTDGVGRMLEDFLRRGTDKKALTDGRRAKNGTGEIRLGLGSCCIAGGSGLVWEELERNLERAGIQTTVKRVGCVGMCHRTPLLEIDLPDRDPILYEKVRPEDVPSIVGRHFRPKSILSRIKNTAVRTLENLLEDPSINGFSRHPLHARDPQVGAFLGRQIHIATEHYGQIDPIDLDEYRRRDGFKALEDCLKGKTPDEVIDRIKASGLRGRGGAGFPTGEKWRITRASGDPETSVICNGDEGDPGAFMDRMILESYPFRVIEGMAVAAYAVGAGRGYFYIRAEYPLAVRRVRAALNKCREAGFLGTRIFGSAFSLDLDIMEGAGAFVCGEETALIASMEGKRGNPVFRPPYPAQKGLWGHATLVNNCETLATVPWILRHGVESYTRLGTEKSKGTKVFSLAGKVARGGLIEVPMGITIREIVEDIGGGIEGGGSFKAVQIGGPSGGCVPAERAGTRVDYEDLTRVGAMMGSGGLLVLDDSDCMVDIARYFLTFTCRQSCGKCTFCRIGTRRMLSILDAICEGRGRADDLNKLEEIAAATQRGSLCGLGKTAPNPVLTTLAYFRDEYEAHLNGVCPAKKCKALITYGINERCIGCTICAQNCPSGAIQATPYKKHTINGDDCIKCGTCLQVCPENAVEVR
ncbi:MAG: NAD(P)H-dependent oxidoreductase subunit E [Acidobacteriota bacterium]